MTFPFLRYFKCYSKKTLVEKTNLSKDLLDYSKKLEMNNLPVIFTLEHLCLASNFSIFEARNICDSNRIPHHKRFKLKKKRGGYRLIQSPVDNLKYLQKWILIHILDKIPSHECSFGFDKESSILKNATVHLSGQAIMKMDLMKFYDSINERRVYGVFKELGYHTNLSVSLAKILTVTPDSFFFKTFKKNETHLKEYLMSLENGFSYEQGLITQGSPSSPKLANLVCRSLDNRLNKLALKYDLKYSRYADDLTFSGEIESLKKIKKIASHIVKDEKFFVNHSKTKFLKPGGKFIVTGLNIENGKVTVPRKMKKEVEHHLHHCLKNGVASHITKAGIPNGNFKEWLLGKIAFIHSIEKDVAATYFDDFNKVNWPI